MAVHRVLLSVHRVLFLAVVLSFFVVLIVLLFRRVFTDKLIEIFDILFQFSELLELFDFFLELIQFLLVEIAELFLAFELFSSGLRVSEILDLFLLVGELLLKFVPFFFSKFAFVQFVLEFFDFLFDLVVVSFLDGIEEVLRWTVFTFPFLVLVLSLAPQDFVHLFKALPSVLVASRDLLSFIDFLFDLFFELLHFFHAVPDFVFVRGVQLIFEQFFPFLLNFADILGSFFQVFLLLPLAKLFAKLCELVFDFLRLFLRQRCFVVGWCHRNDTRERWLEKNRKAHHQQRDYWNQSDLPWELHWKP